MSAQYWSMKLDGCYVKKNSDGVFYQINDVSYEPVDGPRRDHKYPEDMLHDMRFHLAGDRWLRRKSFEIEWPHEGYRRIDSKPVFASRRMKKQYKLAPSNESWQTSTRAGLKGWLNAPTPRFDDPLRLKEDNKDMIFSNEIALINTVPNNGAILYGDSQIIEVNRSKDKIVLASLKQNLPDDVMHLFDGMLDRDVKYTGPFDEAENELFEVDGRRLEVGDKWRPRPESQWNHTTHPNLTFVWTYYGEYDEEIEVPHWGFVFLQEYDEDNDEPFNVAVMIGWSGRTFIVYDYWDADHINVPKELRPDIKALLNYGEIVG